MNTNEKIPIEEKKLSLFDIYINGMVSTFGGVTAIVMLMAVLIILIRVFNIDTNQVLEILKTLIFGFN